MIVTLTIPGEPAVKERPRCGKRVRSSERQIQAEHRVARLFQERYIVPELHTAEVGLSLLFYTAREDKDASNMLKLVEDALNGVLWVDDSQVKDIHVNVQRPDLRGPRTVMEILLWGETTVIERGAQECPADEGRSGLGEG